MADQEQNTNQIPFAFFSSVQQKRAQTDCLAFSQRGSALIVCLSMMPLVISAVIAASSIIWFLSAKNELLYLCESGLLGTQTKLVAAENELLKLNAPIEKLVREKKILTRALALSPTPAERVVIQSQLIKIKLQLMLYKKRQLSLIALAQGQAHKTIQNLASTLQKKLFHFQKQWAAHLKVLVQKTNPRIHLEPKSIDALATVYEVPAGFEKKQTQTMQWQLHGQSLFPSWVRLLHSKKFYWQDSCSSRPQKKETNKWVSEIGEGTSSSKHFY